MTAPPPVHVEHSGSFLLPFGRDRCFPLFSPDGERRWVKGWEPRYLYPPQASTDPGTIFRTDVHGEETLWLILRYSAATSVAEYARITPGSRMGTVRVECTERGPGETLVLVTYSLTGLTSAGNAILAEMTPERYAAMLVEWKDAILRELQAAG